MTFKKTLISLVIAAGALGLGAQDLGGPVVNGKAWGWSLGGGYDYWTHEVRLDNRTNSTNDSATSWRTGKIYLGDTVKLSSNRFFVDAGFNLGRNWKLTFRAGLSSVRGADGLDAYIDATDPYKGTKFDANAGSAGLAFRGTFFKGQRFSLGLVGSGNIFANVDHSRTYQYTYTFGTPPNTYTVTYDGNNFMRIAGYRDGAVALAFETKIGKAALYGGPLYNRQSGRIEASNMVKSTNNTTGVVSVYNAAPVKTHFSTPSQFGGYLGVRMPSEGEWMANLEASYRSKGLNIGFSFSRMF